MAHCSHIHLRSLIVKKSMKSRTFWMLDSMDKDVNFNISSIGRAIHTLMTHGLITRTCMHLTFSKNSTLPTLLQLDEPKYKRSNDFTNQIPIPLLHS